MYQFTFTWRICSIWLGFEFAEHVNLLVYSTIVPTQEAMMPRRPTQRMPVFEGSDLLLLHPNKNNPALFSSGHYLELVVQ
jgi:hypothetical protein